MPNPAVVFTRVNEVEIRDVPLPGAGAGPGEVTVRATHSTISVGTEGWILQNLFTWSPTPYPCVPGYQQAGVVTAVGEGVEQFRVGDRVMSVGGDWPGSPGAFWGGHIHECTVAVGRVFALPAGVSDADASALVVAEVGYNASHRPALNEGEWVVVFGDGLIGQFGAQGARARGAKVVLVGHREERLKLAAAHSADAVVNSHRGVVLEQVRKITGSQRVPVVIDTVQNEAAQKQYIDLLEPIRGQIVYSGFTPGTAWADMGLLQQRELTTHFIAGWNRPRMEATLRLLAEGKMKVAPLITHRVPYTQAPEMYRMMLAKHEPFLGITFEWPA
jgi:2-desacetyl-2-hydroxyethyl bacteriochlorophyllide A dehydrogenase